MQIERSGIALPLLLLKFMQSEVSFSIEGFLIVQQDVPIVT